MKFRHNISDYDMLQIIPMSREQQIQYLQKQIDSFECAFEVMPYKCLLYQLQEESTDE